MRITAILTGILLVLAFCSHAQTEARKYSNEFLDIGIGARAAGLGNTMTAMADDATAAYWNPAGLMHVQKNHEIALMHNEYFAGVIKYDYGGFTTAMDNGKRLALSVIRMGVDDIPNTLNFRDGNSFDYARITSFSVADMAFLASYAQNIKGMDGLSIGANVKVVNRRVGNFATAWGFGLDAGAMYRKNGFSVGAMASDITSTFNAWSFNTETFEDAFRQAGQEIPQNSVEVTLPSLRLGGAYTFMREKDFNITPVLDFDINFDGKRNVAFNLGGASFDPSLGLELSYKKIAYLRGGLQNLQEGRNEDGDENIAVYPTAGVGVQYKFFAIDYAMANIADFDNAFYSHVISLRLLFDNIKL